MTRIRLIIYIEDHKEVPSINHVYIEDIKAKETIVVNIVTISHPIRSNAISVINLDASEVSI